MMIHIFWRGLGNIFLIFLPYVVKRCTVLHDVQNVPSNYFMIFLNLIIFYPMCWYRSITPYAACYANSQGIVSRSIFSSCVYIMYMVGSRSCRCLVAWLCYQLMARPGGGTAAAPWPDPCAYEYMHFFLVFDITISYWISTILVTKKGSFTCAYLLFTWFYLSFIAFIICFYCLYVSMLRQKWRNKTVKSIIKLCVASTYSIITLSVLTFSRPWVVRDG